MVHLLLHAGVSLLNISLDTLRPDRFEQMTRRRGLERVLETIHAAVDHGFDPVKVLSVAQHAYFVTFAEHVNKD